MLIVKIDQLVCQLRRRMFLRKRRLLKRIAIVKRNPRQPLQQQLEI